jgi:hypothetical protein
MKVVSKVLRFSYRENNLTMEMTKRLIDKGWLSLLTARRAMLMAT